MNRYLNMKQLYFLLFIGAMYLIAWWWRSDANQQSRKSGIHVVESRMQQEFRQHPYRLSDKAACQQSCRAIGDSSLALILQYGITERKTKDTVVLRGRSLAGEPVWLYMRQGDTNTIYQLTTPYSSFHCDCPTPDQEDE